MNKLLSVTALGLLSGFFLTLMDRIDEHRIIERHRTLFAYLAGIAAAGCMAWSVARLEVVYPLYFALCLEWIIKNKIEYPSHVFCLFLFALYLGNRLDLFMLYWPYIIFFAALRYLSGTVLKKRLANRPGFWHWWYKSYWEKLFSNGVLALLLGSPTLLLYIAGFSAACLYTKRLMPGKEPAHE